MSVISVSDAEFDANVLKSDKPVVLDFWAEWCGPCKMIAPVLDKIANDLGDKVTIAKMNVDENQETPSKYGVRGIPMLVLFKDGEVQSTKVGALPEKEITEWITSQI